MGIYHYVSFGLFALFAALDFVTRARHFPEVTHWRLKGLAFTALYFAVATYAPFLWDGWLGAHQLLNGSALPFWAQVVIGFVLLEFGIYAWHRTMHNTQPLWRWFHQMHHSAERVDIWGAFYFHPLDMLGWTLLSSLVLVLGIGFTPEATLVVAVLSTFCSMFQHSNIRTPRWLGYFVTRPESHSLHHERGAHRYNYGDVPWFDILFGTFRNPREWQGEAGFHDGGSKQVLPMLFGREIA